MSKRQRTRRDERRQHGQRGARRRRVAAGAGLALGATLAVPAVGHAQQTFTVTNTTDTVAAGDCTTTPGTCSLRDAINAVNADGADTAAAPDQIVFQSGLSGSINLQNASGYKALPVTKPVQITGPGAGTLAVNGQGSVNLFDVNESAATDPVGISGLTLEGGYNSSANGGAIYSKKGALTIASSTLSGNYAKGHQGGGIYSHDALTITSSTLSGNQTYGSKNGGAIDSKGPVTIDSSTLSNNYGYYGGGIYAGSSAPLTITNSTLDFNNAYKGGAIDARDGLSLSGSTLSVNSAKYDGGALTYGALTIAGSTISGNSAYVGDGGLDAGGVSDAKSITNSTISGNSAAYNGGAFIFGSATLTGDTISHNAAYGGGSDGGGYGGGLSLDSFGTHSATVRNTTISGNSATRRGGGLYIYESGSTSAPASTQNVKLESVTVAGNRATRGGGILNRTRRNDDAPPSLSNTIVAGNSASAGGADLDLAAGTTDPFATSFSLIQNAPSTAFTPAASDVLGKDPQLGPLASNGGPTQTQAPSATSPALDQGSSPDTTDQRGSTRPVDLPTIPNSTAAGANAADIGAFEVQSIPLPPPVIPPAPAAAHLSLSGPIHVGPNGVTLKLHCTQATCKGLATMTTIERLKKGKVRSLVASKLHRRRVTVGSKAFSIPAGKTVTITIPLDAKGRALLKHFGRLPFKLTVSVKDPSGKPVVVKNAKSVIKKKHHKRKH